jgi:hypothetical protein
MMIPDRCSSLTLSFTIRAVPVDGGLSGAIDVIGRLGKILQARKLGIQEK